MAPAGTKKLEEIVAEVQRLLPRFTVRIDGDKIICRNGDYEERYPIATAIADVARAHPQQDLKDGSAVS